MPYSDTDPLGLIIFRNTKCKPTKIFTSSTVAGLNMISCTPVGSMKSFGRSVVVGHGESQMDSCSPSGSTKILGRSVVAGLGNHMWTHARLWSLPKFPELPRL